MYDHNHYNKHLTFIINHHLSYYHFLYYSIMYNDVLLHNNAKVCDDASCLLTTMLTPTQCPTCLYVSKTLSQCTKRFISKVKHCLGF